uniref:Uncharacterized protein n=1 Tax=Timema poppense TaxID=170557 RepID=A0A7R9HAJ8_TIMPO|nr:unnamed protein product [Timema poppensis]
MTDCDGRPSTGFFNKRSTVLRDFDRSCSPSGFLLEPVSVSAPVGLNTSTCHIEDTIQKYDNNHTDLLVWTKKALFNFLGRDYDAVFCTQIQPLLTLISQSITRLKTPRVHIHHNNIIKWNPTIQGFVIIFITISPHKKHYKWLQQRTTLPAKHLSTKSKKFTTTCSNSGIQKSADWPSWATNWNEPSLTATNPIPGVRDWMGVLRFYSQLTRLPAYVFWERAKFGNY